MKRVGNASDSPVKECGRLPLHNGQCAVVRERSVNGRFFGRPKQRALLRGLLRGLLRRAL